MNKTTNLLVTLTLIIVASSMSYGQTSVSFASFEAWRQNEDTKKMEYLKTIKDSGYLNMSQDNTTIEVHNNRLNESELIEFNSFENIDNGHMIGFGVEKHKSFSFIPEDRLFLIQVNDIIIMRFNLTSSDVERLKQELY